MRKTIALLSLLLWSALANAAYTVVQTANTIDAICGSGTAITATFSSNVGVGNAIIAMAQWNSATATASVADNHSNAFTAGPQAYDSVVGNDDEMFVLLNEGSSTTNAVTITLTASSGHCGLFIMEVSGLTTSGTGVAFSTNTGMPLVNPGSDPISTNSLANPTSNASIFVGLGSDNNKNGTGMVPAGAGTSLAGLGTNPFNWKESGDTQNYRNGQYQRITSGGSYQSQFNSGASYDRFNMLSVIVNESGGGAPANNTPLLTWPR